MSDSSSISDANDSTQGSGLIYDWNVDPNAPIRPMPRFEIFDETLRDGCQSPSVRMPSIDQKIELLHLMDALGIAWCDLGLPGAGRKAEQDIATLLNEITRSKLNVKGAVLCRTIIEPDVRKAVDLIHRTGAPLTAYIFIGSSPIRQWVEGWSSEFMLKQTQEAVSFAVKEGLNVVYATEDTTRSHPETIRTLFDTALNAGARGLCIADTVGHLTNPGLGRIYRHVRNVIREAGFEGITLDFHGHNDRGLGLPLALEAVDLGFDRIHSCALGIGERVGNTSLDHLLLNLKLQGIWQHDTSRLVEYVTLVSKYTDVEIPFNYPLAGRDAFRTSTGIHAGAIVKALEKGETDLADRVYSAVPAALFGRQQEIEIGPMSGVWSITYWLRQRSFPTDSELIELILGRAKGSDHVLCNEELMSIVEVWRAARAWRESAADTTASVDTTSGDTAMALPAD